MRKLALIVLIGLALLGCGEPDKYRIVQMENGFYQVQKSKRVAFDKYWDKCFDPDTDGVFSTEEEACEYMTKLIEIDASIKAERTVKRVVECD